MHSLISPAEIIKKFHISYQTLNYYTNLGLLCPVIKKGNKRYYQENTLKQRLYKIQKLKDQGYTLRLIGKMLNEGQARQYELF
jgi:DNA-binding transcriptional MerR regulator